MRRRADVAMSGIGGLIPGARNALQEVFGVDSARYAEYLAALEEELGSKNVALNINRINVFR